MSFCNLGPKNDAHKCRRQKNFSQFLGYNERSEL